MKVKTLALAWTCLLLTIPCSADIIYVKVGGTGSGTSWAGAYGKLQDGLDDADSGDEIWVAEGTYYPTYDYGLGTGDRGKHFRMKNGVKIYGGFPDTGDPDMSDRDPNMCETILSGDIGVADDDSDNCYHVFYHPFFYLPSGTDLDETAILDGFTITGGNADGPGYPESHNRGGGMFNRYSSPTVTGCTFTGNSASRGGGMYNGESNPAVISCTFSGNSSDRNGGGMYNIARSKPKVISCTFSGNSSDRNGGGMYNENSSSPTVTNCVFSGNSAERGAGMHNYGHCNAIVTNCIFTGNSADIEGGGIYSGGTPKLINSILWGNTANNGGNEIKTYSSGNPAISYCDIAGCGGSGGGWDPNLGTDGGGNIDEEPRFVNPGHWDPNGTPTDPNNDFWVDGDYHLQPSSPCIEAGDNRSVRRAIDLEGQPRIMDGDGNGEAVVDMGTYEYYGPAYEPTVIYVNAGATEGNNNGMSWEDAFISLQDALDAVIICDQIWAAAGTYYPSYDYGLGIGERGKHFRMKHGVAIYGGFAGTETSLDQRDVQNNVTILSGDIGTTDDPNDNCYHVFYHPDGLALEPSAILDGFTITAGNTNGPWPHYYGGGMDNNYSSPTVTNCTFGGNSADAGGGMCNYESNPTVTNCIFSGNSANSGGGMLNSDDSRPTVTNCTFRGNWTDYGGGMFNIMNSSPTVTNCTFTGNSAAWVGGAMFNYMVSSPTVTSCMFSGNFSKLACGGMYNGEWSSPSLTNCTFTLNRSTYAGIGGGIYNWYKSNPKLTNCILWGNNASSGGNEILNSHGDYLSTPVISHCDIGGCGGSGSWDPNLGIDGGGNIDAEPEFVDPGYWDTNGTPTDPNDDFWVDGDYHLDPTSPCIDVGDNSVVNANSTDLDGNGRIINSIIDMGAYEALLPVEADVHVVPRVINRNNRLKRVMAIVRLPEGITKRDIADQPFVLYVNSSDADGIETIWDRVIGRGNQATVFALFDKAEVMDAVGDVDRVDLTVVGRLESGQYIQGSDTVRIVKPRRRRPNWQAGRQKRLKLR